MLAATPPNAPEECMTPLDPETINQQLQLLETYRRTLAQFLQQQALLGGPAYANLGIINGIADARVHIKNIKIILRDNKMPIEDHPDDDLLPLNKVLDTIRESMPQEQITIFERLITTIRQLIAYQGFVSEIKHIHNMLHNLKGSLGTVTPLIRKYPINQTDLQMEFISIIWNNSIIYCLRA
jgi:hypothetical protein